MNKYASLYIIAISYIFFGFINPPSQSAYSCEELKVEAEIEHTTQENPAGSISLTVKGGQEPYQFHWFGEGARVKIEKPQKKDQLNLKAGEYLVVVRDTNGCLKTVSYTVK
ncbi:MAG: SprB repeat-containing protein [Bacteroidota bacterium]